MSNKLSDDKQRKSIALEKKLIQEAELFAELENQDFTAFAKEAIRELIKARKEKLMQNNENNTKD